MYKIRINSRIRAIFMAIIGIFLINSVKIYGTEPHDNQYLINFLAMLHDDTEIQICKRLFDYMCTTERDDRKRQIKTLLEEEFKKVSEHKKIGDMYYISERAFQYAFGEVCNKVIPVFPIMDDDALNLMAIYYDKKFEDVKKTVYDKGSKYPYVHCKKYDYDYVNNIICKLRYDSRFISITEEEYYEIFSSIKNGQEYDIDMKRFPFI